MKSAQKIIAAVSAGSLYLSAAMSTFAIQICPSGSALCPSGTPTIETFLSRAFSIIALIAALIALIFLIWGGIKWITAGGDKTKVQTARDTIVGAIIGLIIVFVAYFVISFIFQLVTGTSLTGGFVLPSLLKGDAIQ